MANTRQDLIDILNQAYPDHFLHKQRDKVSDDLKELNLHEALAAYVIREVEELHDPNSSGAKNAKRVAASLARSAHLLEQLAALLSEEYEET